MTTPLSAEDLDVVERPLGEARGLPQRAYHDEAIFALETSAFLAPAFHLICRESDVRAPGTVYLATVLGSEILLSRGPDLELRGFFNVCRHRGSALLDAGRSGSREIVCPYHGQRYDLAGRAISRAPCPVTPGERLRPVRVATFGGFVFASLAEQGPSLDAALGDVPEALLSLGLRSLMRVRESTWEVAANWKLLVENFLESHHYPSVHPALEALTPHGLAETLADPFPWNGGLTLLAPHAETVSEDGGRHGRRFLPGLEEGERDRVRDYHLFPTLLVSRQPDYLLTYRLDPRSAGLTRVVHALLVHPESVGAHEGLVAFWDRLNAEDARAVERQQRGVRSRGYEPGLIADNEDGLWRFLQEIVVAHRRAQD